MKIYAQTVENEYGAYIATDNWGSTIVSVEANSYDDAVGLLSEELEKYPILFDEWKNGGRRIRKEAR